MLTAKEALLKTQNAKKDFKEKSIKFFNSEKKHIEQDIIKAAEEGKTKVNIHYAPSDFYPYGLKSSESIDVLIECIKQQLIEMGYKCSISYNTFTNAFLVTCSWEEK